jgi:hypothetical protein
MLVLCLIVLTFVLHKLVKYKYKLVNMLGVLI